MRGEKDRCAKVQLVVALPETNSSLLKMVVSNRNLRTSRGLFSGAKMLVSVEGVVWGPVVWILKGIVTNR